MGYSQEERIRKVASSISNIARRKKPKPQQISTRLENDPMRVAIVCPYSMSVPGGVQNQVLLLSAKMRSLGIDARIIAPCDGALPVPYIMSVGKTRSLKSNGSLAPIVVDPQASSLTLDALYSFNPDVIHLHEPLVPGPTSAAMIGGEGAIVATFHAAGEGIGALKYFRHPARGAVSRVHQRVAVSNEANALAEQYLPGDYKIIPNCIDIERIRNAKPLSDVKKNNKLKVLFVGRHEERKGLSFLVDAWLSSSYCMENAELWIAGTGALTEELVLKSKHSASVNFLGRISNEELFRRMKSSEVVVAPALYGESFGIVLLEAMAASACVIASDIPGYRDVARNGIEALLVSPGNSDSLKEALELVLKDDGLRQKLINAGIERLDQFSVDVVVDKYISVYKAVIEKRKADL